MLGVDPLRIFVYKEGLVRFATEEYKNAYSKSNIKNLFMHLTNYAINKKNDNFNQNDDEETEGENDETTHKWPLDKLWWTLE